MLQHAICILTVFSLGANWPTYQGNLARTGVSKETITPTLQEDWRHESAPPRPAWPEPARQDFWHSKFGLAPSVTFDRVHQVVAADGRVYFGSTVNDAVTCLDAATGKSIWTFYSEGPVRLAPIVVDNHVYFGSDDGYAYCVSAADGALVWKRRIADKDRRIGGNGRMISAWPLRCGVLVDNGTVYCTAGIFPTYGVWLAALDAGSGEVSWRRRLETIAPQGYMLASPTRLYVPTGRTSPAVFDRKDGKPVDLSGIGRRGGTFALIVDEGLVHRGDGEDQIELQTGAGDRMALFAGRQAIVDGETAYLLDNNKLSALNRARYIRLAHERQKLIDAEKADERTDETKRTLAENAKAMETCWLWREKSEQQGVMLLAQDTIIVGGQDEVAIRDTSDGSLLRTLSIHGDAHGLSVANGRLLVSTDRGVIHSFTSGPSSGTPSPPGQVEPAAETSDEEGDTKPLQLTAGPHVRHLAPDSVEITWACGGSPRLELHVFDAGVRVRSVAARLSEAGEQMSHMVVVNDLTPRKEYTFRITSGEDGTRAETELYVFDSSCDVPDRPRPEGDTNDEASTVVGQIIESCGSGPGYAILIKDDGPLALELARCTDLQLIVVQPNEDDAASVRAKLTDAGIYGTRAVVHCAPLDHLPYADQSMNLVFYDLVQHSEPVRAIATEARRVLRPGSGRIWLKTSPQTRFDTAEAWMRTGVSVRASDQRIVLWHKPLKQRGQWSHLYSDPSGKASSDETLHAPLQLQWFGRPGPKHMIDRHHRGMSPLVVNGRIFLPGNERLKGVDAFNGSILWDLTLPGFRRVAMMRDSGHLAAQKDEVFAVVRDGCRVIDAATGRWLRTLPLPESKNGAHEYWGYLAVIDDAVLGTTEAAGASFDQHMRDIPARISFWDDVPVVVGKTLFNLDRQSGKPRWVYQNTEGSVLLHSTIVTANDGIYFVESRAPEAVAAEDGRITLEVACAPGASWLVALDLASGEKLWERPVELPQIRNVLHAVCAENTIILAGTHNEQRHPRYDLLAFNTSDGSPSWSTHYLRTDKPTNGDHGEQDQHPVVIGKTLYSRPYAFDVHTGEKLDFQLDRGGHGCGGLSGSACHLFGRGRNPRMYELDAGPQSGTPVTQVTRPGCWINMIAADSLLLIPEGSSGCSCAFSIQTSLGLAPVQE
jgi:outer membrane protein assembly factor BamB